MVVCTTLTYLLVFFLRRDVSRIPLFPISSVPAIKFVCSGVPSGLVASFRFFHLMPLNVTFAAAASPSSSGISVSQ
jgi:hypothetical protein